MVKVIYFLGFLEADNLNLLFSWVLKNPSLTNHATRDFTEQVLILRQTLVSR